MTAEGKKAVSRWQVIHVIDVQHEEEIYEDFFVDVETAATADDLELWLDANQVDWEAYAPHYSDGTWGAWVHAWE